MIDFSSRTTEKGTLVIQASGVLDNDTTEYFFDCVRDEIARGHKKIVINFDGLGYISSLGLGALVRASSRAAKEGGTIYLACIENQVLDILRVVSFDKIFLIFDTEDEAIWAIEE
jgi:anti-anti-sigma factor